MRSRRRWARLRRRRAGTGGGGLTASQTRHKIDRGIPARIITARASEEMRLPRLNIISPMGQRSVGFLCVVASSAFGQQAPTAGSPDATFRTTTKLIQVSVVAQDKQGKPVLDLRREEFQIFDNGSPQNIQLFLAETEKSNLVAPEAGARNTFTNRIAAGSHNGYSVILIDNLFTIFGDPDKEPGGRALARLQALWMLRSIPSGEKIAIYAVGRKFAVICEFTSDRDLLERQLAAWKPSVDAPATWQEILGDPLGHEPDEIAIASHANSNLVERLFH